jgi:hypothetical protein
VTTEDLRDLIRLLETHPEWRAELRRLVLTDELLDLPRVVRQLAEAQRRTEERLAELAEAQCRTEARLAELAEAQRRTEERVGRLEVALAELAEAQRRTEERVGRLEVALAELAEAQRRTEARLAELAEAQRRTEERVGRLEVALAELAEAQRRTEARLAELAEAQRRTEEQIADLNLRMGRLANLVGADIESDAEDVLLAVLRTRGLQPGEPRVLQLDGEVDVALPVTTQDGRALWALVEAKVRVRRSDVLGWARRLADPGYRARLAEHGIAGPYLAWLFGLRVYDEALVPAREHGLGLLNVRGERLAPAERR